MLAGILGEIAVPSADTEDGLAAALVGGGESLRARGRRAIGELGTVSASAEDALAAALKDGAERVRTAACLAIGEISTSSRFDDDLIAAALHDESPDVAHSACAALARGLRHQRPSRLDPRTLVAGPGAGGARPGLESDRRARPVGGLGAAGSTGRPR